MKRPRRASSVTSCSRESNGGDDDRPATKKHRAVRSTPSVAQDTDGGIGDNSTDLQDNSVSSTEIVLKRGDTLTSTVDCASDQVLETSTSMSNITTSTSTTTSLEREGTSKYLVQQLLEHEIAELDRIAASAWSHDDLGELDQSESASTSSSRVDDGDHSSSRERISSRRSGSSQSLWALASSSTSSSSFLSASTLSRFDDSTSSKQSIADSSSSSFHSMMGDLHNVTPSRSTSDDTSLSAAERYFASRKLKDGGSRYPHDTTTTTASSSTNANATTSSSTTTTMTSTPDWFKRWEGFSYDDTAPDDASSVDGTPTSSQSQRGTRANGSNWWSTSPHTKEDAPAYKWVKDTPFLVDAFRHVSSACSHYFLSHFHSDHYGGLTTTFNSGMIYCSEITARLVVMQLKVDCSYVVPLPMNRWCIIDDVPNVEVYLIDANHCPGAVLFLFKVWIETAQSHRYHLHTGDFRYDRTMQESILATVPVHNLYLDTTYCIPPRSFPPQQECIERVVQMVAQERRSAVRTKFLFGTYQVGKERVLEAVARKFGCRIYAPTAKLGIFNACNLDMNLFTCNKDETDFEATPIWSLKPEALQQLVAAPNSKYRRVVSFRCTGWTSSGQEVRHLGTSVSMYSIPYSEHSSYSELCEFVQWLRPFCIIPTVNVSRSKEQEQMLAKQIKSPLEAIERSKQKDCLSRFLKPAADIRDVSTEEFDIASSSLSQATSKFETPSSTFSIKTERSSSTAPAPQALPTTLVLPPASPVAPPTTAPTTTATAPPTPSAAPMQQRAKSHSSIPTFLARESSVESLGKKPKYIYTPAKQTKTKRRSSVCLDSTPATPKQTSITNFFTPTPKQNASAPPQRKGPKQTKIGNFFRPRSLSNPTDPSKPMTIELEDDDT